MGKVLAGVALLKAAYPFLINGLIRAISPLHKERVLPLS